MATIIDHREAELGIERGETSRLTSDKVWREIAKASFAVVGYVTPSGEPRSSGVVYTAVGRRLYVATDPGSWKARHIPATGRVAVTVPVRRGGLLSLMMPIPPATVSFQGRAIVHPPVSAGIRPILKELGSLLPPERQDSATVIEIIPEGAFVTYGLGVSLSKMRDAAAARGRIPVGSEAGTSRPEDPPALGAAR